MDDVFVIQNCLNGACNGIHLDDFELKVGVRRDHVRGIMRQVNAALAPYEGIEPGRAQ